jgi:uncharacterized protein (DUF885 family)
LQENAREIIERDVITSYKKIRDFFEGEYRNTTRTTLGASAMPNGKDFYEDRVRFFTTTNSSSEEVYQLGLKEVARIKVEMDKVLQQVNFKGTFKEFIEMLRTDPKFYSTSGDLAIEGSGIHSKEGRRFTSFSFRKTSKTAL